MREEKDTLGMMDLMIRPGFCVRNNEIIKVNPPAAALMLTVGENVEPLLLTGREEYARFTEGCLSLMLTLGGQTFEAIVTAREDCHVFVVDRMGDALQSLALAAQALREPLANLMISAQQLRSGNPPAAARMNRNLYQLLRIVGNMSDAGRRSAHMETRNLCALFEETFEKARTLVDQTGVCLRYQGLKEDIYGLCDPELLERGILNILSNSVKFTPRGGWIEAELTRNQRMLMLTVRDSGSGIAENVRSTVFSRYLRQPTIEDSRYGIGLGFVLIRSAAHLHGGTVLIDQPGEGTRVTMTLAIRQDPAAGLRSPRIRVDYAGEQDHCLIELADSLPPELFEL